MNVTYFQVVEFLVETLFIRDSIISVSVQQDENILLFNLSSLLTSAQWVRNPFRSVTISMLLLTQLRNKITYSTI